MKAVQLKAGPLKPGHAHAGHRHTAPGQHEHEFEPQYGLPEVLPAGERLLWQGAPDWKLLAVQRFHVRKLVIYFGVLLAARVAGLLSDGMPVGPAVLGSLALFSLSVLAVGAALLMAWLTARTTVYTLTDKRVVMRIGIVLTLTLNLPFRRIQSAGLNAQGGKTGAAGDIALTMTGSDRIAYLHLWPHARRWHFKQPQPTLLCLPDARGVAERLTSAWQTWQAANGDAARALTAGADEPVLQDGKHSGQGSQTTEAAMPSLATPSFRA